MAPGGTSGTPRDRSRRRSRLGGSRALVRRTGRAAARGSARRGRRRRGARAPDPRATDAARARSGARPLARRARLVAPDPTACGSRLAARRGPGRHRRHPRRRRHHPQRAGLRLPVGNRLHGAVGGPHVRPVAPPGCRSIPLLLGADAHRAHDPQLGVRRREAPRHLDRDPQGARRGILRAARLLPAVRALLRGRRRARRRAAANELPRRAGVPVSPQGLTGARPAVVGVVSRADQSAGADAALVQRAHA